MSIGLIDCVANGGPIDVTASYLGLNANIAVTVATAGSMAWQQTAPLATALVSDFPGRDTTQANFRSNSRGLYANASFSTEVAFDSSVLYGGYDTLANDRTIANADTKLIIPSHTSQTDIVYHVRRALQSNQINDLIPGIKYANYPSNDNGTMSMVCALGFDSSLYALPQQHYFNGGNPISGVILVVQHNGGIPSYQLVASVWDTTPTVKSDATSNAGVIAATLGDESFASTFADYFLRAYLTGTTLHTEAYMATALSAPKQIATLALTMLDASTPPMPMYGMNNIQEPYWLSPALSRLAFHQIISNSANPNTALDFTAPVLANGIGIGEHGASIVKRTVNIQQYASDVAFKSDGTAGRFLITNPTEGALVTSTDAAHDNKKFFRISQPLNSSTASAGIDDNFQVPSSDTWSKESILLSDGWSNYGAGLAASTLAQNIVASGSPQTITVTTGWADGNNGTGLIGYGTANVEQVAYTHANNATTITGVFTKNHSTGDEVSQAQGPGYKIVEHIWALNSNQTNPNVSCRMELVGRDMQSYIIGSLSFWDTAFPTFSELGATGISGDDTGYFRVVAMSSGTPTDMVTTPTGNAQGASGFSGTRAGQGIELQFRWRTRVWFDSDYGRFRGRLEHYIGVPGSPPAHFQYLEGFMLGTITTAFSTAAEYGINFNERCMADQTVDRWDEETCDPNAPSVGVDPYTVVAQLGLAVPNAGTCGSAASPTTTTLTYPVTAPATGSTVLHVIAEVFNGTVWVPINSTGTAWTVGAGGTQNIVVTGLTTGTNYTGKIRFRLVSNYGMGAAVICTNGTTI